MSPSVPSPTRHPGRAGLPGHRIAPRSRACLQARLRMRTTWTGAHPHGLRASRPRLGGHPATLPIGPGLRQDRAAIRKARFPQAWRRSARVRAFAVARASFGEDPRIAWPFANPFFLRSARCSSYSRSARGTKSSYHRSWPDLSPPTSNTAVRPGSNAYRIRNGRPRCWTRSSRRRLCRELSTPELCGNGRFGPSRSSNPTVAATDSCSAALRLSHHPPNASVYSTCQIIT